MKYTFTLAAVLLALITFGQKKQFPVTENSTFDEASAKKTETDIDAIFNEAYPSASPGATVLIAKEDKIIYRKAFGMSNLELKVPMKPENVMQLASITKQFTSVSILMLMEQGKLSLRDSLSKYIDDYPRGNEITIHHLLNHTSGIRSYTDLPEFRVKTRLDMTPREIISSFKNLPLEFNPGEKHKYSNSGYILLGYIIEKVSGITYEEFIQKNIFDKLGMKHSYYGNSSRIIPDRANGYQLHGDNCENAEYMSTTIPYAAGALMSTVDDMFIWSKAIRHHTLISENSQQMAFTNQLLANGKPDNYGYGWAINEIAGFTSLEHAGGINGFSSSGIYLPGQNIYAIVLTNLDDGKGPETYTIKALSLLLGKPVKDNESVKLSENQLKQWVGAYQFENTVRFIIFENGALYSKREGGRPLKLIPLSENEFRFEDSFTTYQFSLKDGKKQVLFADRIDKSMGTETDKQPLSEMEGMLLPPEILLRFVGTYELQPSFQIEIDMRNNRLFATTTGQPTIELLAETENSFLIREIGARIVFNSETDGTIKSLTFSQGEEEMEGKKIR